MTKLERRLSMLENVSGHMNVEVKAAKSQLDDLKTDVGFLKQYKNVTNNVRTRR